MSFKIVRNDITKMHTEAIVNTANDQPTVGTGCDHAIYKAAGFNELLTYRKEKIGAVEEGEVFITPGFNLPAKYIIHAVSPLYMGGQKGEEEKLRSCYKKSLALAAERGIRSISFPLISTGGFGYPKEEGMRIAVDEIHAFLLTHDMDVYLVVFGDSTTQMGKNIYPDLEAYIDQNYVEEKLDEEYGEKYFSDKSLDRFTRRLRNIREAKSVESLPPDEMDSIPMPSMAAPQAAMMSMPEPSYDLAEADDDFDAIEELEAKLAERMKHMSDTFPQYLLYLIRSKGMENAEVYKRAIVDKKVFSKIKNNPNYHPQKITALCLCIGAKLNLDESRDLLARAGYALSPCDKTDIIFSYFIEHEIYDMIELDIQLEEHGLPCIIS